MSSKTYFLTLVGNKNQWLFLEINHIKLYRLSMFYCCHYPFWNWTRLLASFPTRFTVRWRMQERGSTDTSCSRLYTDGTYTYCTWCTVVMSRAGGAGWEAAGKAGALGSPVSGCETQRTGRCPARTLPTYSSRPPLQQLQHRALYTPTSRRRPYITWGV